MAMFDKGASEAADEKTLEGRFGSNSCNNQVSPFEVTILDLLPKRLLSEMSADIHDVVGFEELLRFAEQVFRQFFVMARYD